MMNIIFQSLLNIIQANDEFDFSIITKYYLRY